MRAVLSALTWLLSALVRGYRAFVSPLLVAAFGARCRFVPTCSEYALESLERHGPFSGSARAVARLCRCHPFHPGGFEPVEPEASPHG